MAYYPQEELKLHLNEVKRKKNIPFRMANKELADELFPLVKKSFPSAQILECNEQQYIVLSQQAANKLKKIFNNKISREKEILNDLFAAVETLSEFDFSKENGSVIHSLKDYQQKISEQPKGNNLEYQRFWQER